MIATDLHRQKVAIGWGNKISFERR
jgi:hypothetical protein